jgi:hypothetical protein
MTRSLRLAAALLLGMSCGGAPAQNQETRFAVTVGEANHVCQSVLKVIRRIPNSDFITSFKWMERFEKRTDWTSAKTLFLRADGERVPFEFSHADFDIDNDGSPELIVGTTNMMHSVLVDRWYVFRRPQLGELLTQGVSESKLAVVPKIDTDSVPGFVPVEFARWSFEGVNYLILREYGFLRNRRPAASLLVAKFDRVVSGPRQVAIAKMTLVCDIRG